MRNKNMTFDTDIVNQINSMIQYNANANHYSVRKGVPVTCGCMFFTRAAVHPRCKLIL